MSSPSFFAVIPYILPVSVMTASAQNTPLGFLQHRASNPGERDHTARTTESPVGMSLNTRLMTGSGVLSPSLV